MSIGIPSGYASFGGIHIMTIPTIMKALIATIMGMYFNFLKKLALLWLGAG